MLFRHITIGADCLVYFCYYRYISIFDFLINWSIIRPASNHLAWWRSGYRASLESLFLRERRFESCLRRSFCRRSGLEVLCWLKFLPVIRTDMHDAWVVVRLLWALPMKMIAAFA
jgi:hypothetical protein